VYIKLIDQNNIEINTVELKPDQEFKYSDSKLWWSSIPIKKPNINFSYQIYVLANDLLLRFDHNTTDSKLETIINRNYLSESLTVQNICGDDINFSPKHCIFAKKYNRPKDVEDLEFFKID
jgi:hypothetical protein